MNRKILILPAILIVLVAAAFGVWRKGLLQPRSAKRFTRQSRAHDQRKLPPSSEALIAKAFAAKEIDYETSLLYRIYALFGDARLPPKYVTEVIDLDAGTALFSEISRHEDELSPATRSSLAPFLARPNDPQSVLYASRSSSARLSLVPTVSAAGAWTNLSAAGGLVKVWTNTDFQLAAPLQTTARDVDLVWPELRKLIRAPTPDQTGYPSVDINPDSAIDVYILPLGQIDPRLKGCAQNPGAAGCIFSSAMGWTVATSPWIGKRASSGYLIIDGSLQDDALLATLAHELFHASQFTYSNRERWLAESTATWAEFRVMKNLNHSTSEETMYLPVFFPSLDTQPLDQLGGTHEYGAYLYFLFAEMESGNAVVNDIWVSTTSLDETKAVDAVFPFKDHFRGFALKNWNHDPVPDRYENEDPTLVNYSASISATTVLLPGEPHALDAPITRLTANYQMLAVADPVAKLRLKFGGDTQNPYIGVDAIVTIEKKDPEVRHWTGQSEVTFCRDDPDERVDTILLIVSNASLEEDLSSKIDLEPESKPCVEKGATLTFNATYTADAKAQLSGSPCTDHITLTYTGGAHYQLLPDDSETLVTRTSNGVQSERTGNFSLQVQGGGSCEGKGGSMVWKYLTKSGDVPPDDFPDIGVHFRSGQYDVVAPDFLNHVESQGQINISGQAPIPFDGPALAMVPLALLKGPSVQKKVSDALHGTFPPFSKRFSNSNRVSDSVDLNNPDGSQGTASLNISYSIRVSRK